MAESFDRARFLEENLERQIEAIRAADTKIVLLVPTSTAMIGVIAALLRGPEMGSLSNLLVILSTLPIITAYAFMALAVIPRMRGAGASLLFFGGIAALPEETYRDRALAMTGSDYLADLARQCHATACIARSKHRHVRRAYVAFFTALPFWALAVYLLQH